MLPTATFSDAARTIRDVLLPVVAQGAIVRRPAASRAAELLRADDRALRRVRALRRRYGEGPLLIRVPGRTIALVLDPDHVHRILRETPEPFSAATSDKVGALQHFQPHAVLATDPPLRAPRREANEEALDSHHPVHRHAELMVAAITAELHPEGTLGWNDFREIWSRIVRRIVLGDKARDDTELTALLDVLRSNANWAALHPRNRNAQQRLDHKLGEYVENAAPGSLVESLMLSTITRDSRIVEPGGGLDPAGRGAALVVRLRRRRDRALASARRPRDQAGRRRPDRHGGIGAAGVRRCRRRGIGPAVADDSRRTAGRADRDSMGCR